VLSGNIGSLVSDHDNAFHVVVAAGDMGSAALDRLTIQDGNANYVDPATGPFPLPTDFTRINGITILRTVGGGLFAKESSPRVHNVVFLKNRADNDGGGAYFEASAATLLNLTFMENKVTGDGAAMTFWDSNLAVTNVLISGNQGASNGFAANANRSTVRFTNATVSGNRGTSGNGGAISANHSSVVWLRNSIAVGNLADTTEADTYEVNLGKVYPRMSYVGDWIYNQAGDPGKISLTPELIFVSPVDATSAPTAAGNYRLKPYGFYGIESGYSGYYAAGQTPDLTNVTTDLDLNPRFAGTSVDSGAYEFGATSNVDEWWWY
jgi:hypothetical protein